MPEGVPPWAWDKIGAKREGEVWEIPERNADGEIIGTALRRRDGSKGFRRGGHRGLSIAWPLDAYTGTTTSDPLYCVEGPTDAAAGLGLSLDMVGRPSAAGGAAHLAGVSKGRHLCIIAENDANGAGLSGARRIAHQLVGSCASVKIISPPNESKDLRAWIIAGATRADVEALVTAAEPIKSPHHAPAAAGTPRGTPETGKTAEDWGTLGARSGCALTIRNLAGVQAEPILWIWPGRVPAGMLTVIAGDPGSGKSTLAVHIAAVVTHGRAWTDQRDDSSRSPGRVLFLTAEDDTTRVLVPKLLAAGADMSLVDVIEGVRRTPTGEPSMFALDRDVELLRARVQANPDTKLIVVDPVTAYLGKAAPHSHNTSVMRGLLGPLKALCESTGVAILVISHLNKDAAGTNATYRVTGSLGLSAHARAVYLLVSDPQNPERRLLLISKINVGRPPPGLAFRLRGDPPTLEWEPDPVNMTAREVLGAENAPANSDPAADEAAEWLDRRLAAGPVDARTVQADARRAGIKERALNSGSVVLRVVKEPVEFGGTWCWRLPHIVSPPVSVSVPQTSQVPRVPHPPPAPVGNAEQTCESIAGGEHAEPSRPALEALRMRDLECPGNDGRHPHPPTAAEEVPWRA